MYPDYAAYGILKIFWVINLILWLAVTPCWILIMKKALETMDPRFRRMNPSETWLTFIPVFGFYWQFAVTSAVAEGFRNELLARGIIPKEVKPGSSVGLTANIFFCTSIIPLFGLLFTLISYIPRTIHIFRIMSYTTQLESVIAVQASYVMENAPAFDWEQYREKAEEATAQMEKTNPERFAPPKNNAAEEDVERWSRK